jgi:DNA replication protein
MKAFSGFPPGMIFTPVPNLFLNRLMPEMADINELKIVLYAFQVLYVKKGYPRFVTEAELLASPGLTASLKPAGDAEPALRAVLDSAEKRGIFIKLTMDGEGGQENIYFLNTEKERQVIEKIKRGELTLPGRKAPATTPGAPPELPNIYALFEDNIAMLGPVVVEQLKDAEKLYPQSWIADAIKEAAALNKRSIRYIIRILERWSAEGRDDGTHRRDIKKDDPDKYFRGKYGHLVQH